MPNVWHLPLGDAITALEAAGIPYRISRSQNQTVPDGDLMSVAPVRATMMRPDMQAVLTVSCGPPRVRFGNRPTGPTTGSERNTRLGPLSDYAGKALVSPYQEMGSRLTASHRLFPDAANFACSDASLHAATGLVGSGRGTGRSAPTQPSRARKRDCFLLGRIKVAAKRSRQSKDFQRVRICTCPNALPCVPERLRGFHRDHTERIASICQYSFTTVRRSFGQFLHVRTCLSSPGRRRDCSSNRTPITGSRVRLPTRPPPTNRWGSRTP